MLLKTTSRSVAWTKLASETGSAVVGGCMLAPQVASQCPSAGPWRLAFGFGCDGVDWWWAIDRVASPVGVRSPARLATPARPAITISAIASRTSGTERLAKARTTATEG